MINKKNLFRQLFKNNNNKLQKNSFKIHLHEKLNCDCYLKQCHQLVETCFYSKFQSL